ncbi:MAG: Gfo/Idh/MocA family oxidoreductase [candidate division Zixibacteria bacterium]|nr:Gfo/Idh/MocA family oxidoreductase [candidate division Zixibacteria bacterium]
MYRIGLIGTGGIARAHGHAARKTEGVEVVAICDVSQEALNRFGDEFGVSARYGDLETMLDRERLDIAIICTWGSLHADISNRIARSRQVKAILCEKPICNVAAECEGMIATARENGILLAEAFKFRHHPQHLKAKEIVEAGEIGAIKMIRSTFTNAGNPAFMTPAHNWRFNRQQGGGAVYDLGCYNIHHARFMMGAEPVRVYATGHVGDRSQVYESVAVQLDFPGDAGAQFILTFRYYGTQTAEIYGTKGYIHIEKAWNNENSPVSMEVRFTNGDKRTYDFAAVDQFALQLGHLRDCLDTGAPHRISPENSLCNMRVIDAVYASMTRGVAVEV